MLNHTLCRIPANKKALVRESHGAGAPPPFD